MLGHRVDLGLSETGRREARQDHSQPFGCSRRTDRAAPGSLAAIRTSPAACRGSAQRAAIDASSVPFLRRLEEAGTSSVGARPHWGKVFFTEGEAMRDLCPAANIEGFFCQRPSKAAQVWPSKIAHLAEVTSL